MSLSDSVLLRRCARHGIAIIVMAVAVAVRLLLNPVLGDQHRFGILLLGVLVTAWVAGFGPALTATGLGTVAFVFFHQASTGRFALEGLDHQLGLAIYLIAGVGMAFLGRILHLARLRAKELAQQERQRQVQAEVAAARRSEFEARQESERRYAALVEAVPQIVWTSEPTGAIDFANRRWYEFSGFTPEQTMGNGWTAAVHPDDLDDTIKRWTHALQTGEPVEVTYRLRNVEGQYRWQLARGVPIKDGTRVLKWFGTLTDIEDQKQAEVVLRAEDRRKDEFLATLSHELRNPLAPIRNMLEVLKQDGPHSDSTQEAIAVMDRQLRQMVRLIDDLLNVTQIRQGRFVLHLQQVELASVVSQAVETCRPLVEAMNHHLSIVLPPHPVYLNGDPVRLTQVFGNLLNNACKYTKPGGHINLSANEQQDTVIVSISDNGRGIPPEMLSRIFQMYAQVDVSEDESQGGLGIGLTLVHRFVELHGGTVEARSQGAGRGSEFVVRLPRLVDHAVRKESPPQQSPESQVSLRILVVDDNRDAALSFATLLEVCGHEVRVALDGAAAVEIARDWKPQLMFCDLAMPGMHGTEVAMQLRQQLGDEAMLVALTGYGSDSDRRRTTAAGFDHHLVKPINSEALNEILSRAEALAVPEPV